jgi:hypothetical protein
MNFGTLKDIFTEKLIESYVSGDKSGKDLYKKYLKILKENETLRTAFIVYKNLETKTIKSEIAANDYVKETVSLLENFRGEKSINYQVKKLTNLLEKSGVDVSSFKTKELHESIQNLITTKKSVSTIDKIHESKNFVVNWLMSEKEIISETKDDFVKPNVDPNRFLEIASKKFNEKYSNLTEEEKSILKALRENDEETLNSLVESLTNENIKLINETLEMFQENISVKEKLLDTKDVIYRMKEDKNSSSEKVLRLYDLKKSLSND